MKRKKITEFNAAFGYPVPSKPTVKANHDLRYKLILEELDEYKEASEQKDIVEIADAIGDMLYLVLGAAVEHGIEIEPVFDEIHRSNMSKLGDNGKPIYREDGKVLKGPDYFKPNIKNALKYSMEYKDIPYVPNIDIQDLKVEVSDYVLKVVDIVANYFDVTVNALAGSSRKQPLPVARHLISYLLHDKFKEYKVYGRVLTNVIPRDRTSYIHGVKMITEGLQFDKVIMTHYKEVTDSIKKEFA